ncbi:hypothetical protein MRX96_018661 [Rhipicephalus microplus]
MVLAMSAVKCEMCVFHQPFPAWRTFEKQKGNGWSNSSCCRSSSSRSSRRTDGCTCSTCSRWIRSCRCGCRIICCSYPGNHGGASWPKAAYLHFAKAGEQLDFPSL